MSDIIDLPLPLPFLSGTHVPVLQVVAGDHNLTDDKGDFYAVSSILVHPEFDSSSKDYDVAILTLRDPITFSATAAPVCLPASVSPLYTGEVATVAGWGDTTQGGSGSPTLMEANLTVISNSQ